MNCFVKLHNRPQNITLNNSPLIKIFCKNKKNKILKRNVVYLSEERHSASNCKKGFIGVVIAAAPGDGIPDAGNGRKEESSGEI